MNAAHPCLFRRIQSGRDYSDVLPPDAQPLSAELVKQVPEVPSHHHERVAIPSLCTVTTFALASLEFRSSSHPQRAEVGQLAGTPRAAADTIAAMPTLRSSTAGAALRANGQVPLTNTHVLFLSLRILTTSLDRWIDFLCPSHN